MPLFFPSIAAQFDLLGNTVGVVIAVVASFVAITLVASYFRFQHIVEVAEGAQPEDLDSTPADILRVQIARCLAGCARRGTTFCLALIRVNNPAVEVRMGSKLMETLKHAARLDDITCIFDEQTGVLLFEADPADSEPIITRINKFISGQCPEVAMDKLRVGLSAYPGHGLRGKDLIEVALEGLKQADEDTPVFMPEIIHIDEDDEEDEDEEDVGTDVREEAVEPGESEVTIEDDDEDEEDSAHGRRARRKSSVVDELTGVLKPSAVSAFMQRTMSELRHKKKKAALYCIGLNNVEHIIRFHGEDAAADVLVGVSKILQENLRTDDLIGRHEKYGFLVLAEASLEQAEIIGKRISTLVQQAQIESGNKKLKTTVTLGVAAHPEHGRNLHQLYMAGQKVLDYSRANDIRAYAVYDPDIHDKVPSKPMKSIKSVK